MIGKQTVLDISTVEHALFFRSDHLATLYQEYPYDPSLFRMFYVVAIHIRNTMHAA